MLLYQLTTKKKKKKTYHNTNKNISLVRTKQRTSRVCVGYSGFGMEGLSPKLQSSKIKIGKYHIYFTNDKARKKRS